MEYLVQNYFKLPVHRFGGFDYVMHLPFLNKYMIILMNITINYSIKYYDSVRLFYLCTDLHHLMKKILGFCIILFTEKHTTPLNYNCEKL